MHDHSNRKLKLLWLPQVERFTQSACWARWNSALTWNLHTRTIFTPMARHFTLPPHVALDAHIPCIPHSVSHLLCAVLALGSAMCNMKNSMFITPVSVRVVCAIVARAGVGITRNFHVVWHTNIMDFPRILTNSARNARTFLPGTILFPRNMLTYIIPHAKFEQIPLNHPWVARC